MDGLHGDAYAHLFHALGRGYFPFGVECPIDPDKASMQLTIHILHNNGAFVGIHEAEEYAELAQDIPLDAPLLLHSMYNKDEFITEMREALRDVLTLAQTCRAAHARLETWGESLLRHARLAAPSLRLKADARHVLAQLNARPLRPEDYLFLVGCIARRAPEEVLPGKHVGPCRKIARGSRASAIYLVKGGGGRLCGVVGSALKPDEQPIFKVGGIERATPTSEIIKRYKLRRALEVQRKEDNRMLRKRKAEEEAAAGEPARKKRKLETSSLVS